MYIHYTYMLYIMCNNTIYYIIYRYIKSISIYEYNIVYNII